MIFIPHWKNSENSKSYMRCPLMPGMAEKTHSMDDWAKMWQEFSKTLDTWKENFELMRKSTLKMQEKFNEVMERASKESSLDTMKLFGENWQKEMTDVGGKSFAQFTESWEKAVADFNSMTFIQFGENWQKSLTETGMDSMKAYGDMLNKFAETWKNMWPQK